jgi:hypothetical protein
VTPRPSLLGFLAPTRAVEPTLPPARSSLVGLIHWTVTEFTAKTAPVDGVVGHAVVWDDGTLAAIDCADCRTRYASWSRGETVPQWPTSER